MKTNMFYIGYLVDILLHKWFFWDVEIMKVMEQSCP